MTDIEKSPIPPPTPEQMALVERNLDSPHRIDYYALRAVLAYARLGVETARYPESLTLPGDDKWLQRCDFCGWPLGDRRSGCAAPDDCSQRPRPHNAMTSWKQTVRRLMAENAKLRLGLLAPPAQEAQGR